MGNRVIKHCRKALARCAEDDPDRSYFLNNLAIALAVRFDRRGEQADLDEAISYHREALALRPEGHLYRLQTLNNLAIDLHKRFEVTGHQVDLDEGTRYHREALALLPEERPDFLHRLAATLKAQSTQTGQQVDPNDIWHQIRAAAHNEVESGSDTSFEQTGDEVNLDEAIGHYRKKLAICPRYGPDRPYYLHTLAGHLDTRFKQTGQQVDLNEAIGHYHEALALLPKGDSDRPHSLNNLAVALETRFKQTGEKVDLDEAIGYYREALALRPQGHPNRSGSLNNMANVLHICFEQTGKQEDLDEAIGYHRQALELTPEGHPDRSYPLNNLANSLHTRFERTGQQVDLDEAIKHYREALELRPQGHPVRSNCLNNLAAVLETQFKQTRQEADLKEAIGHYREGLALCPEGHPQHTAFLGNLAVSRLTQVGDTIQAATGDPLESIPCKPKDLTDPTTCDSEAKPLSLDNLDPAFDLFERAVHHGTSSLQLRLRVSITWIEQARKFQHKSISTAYSAALALVAQISTQTPTLESQHNSFSSKYYNIPKSLVSDAAANAIESGGVENAVEILEQGRNFLWSRLKGFRHPLLLGALADNHFELANEFHAVSFQLEHYATGEPIIMSPGSDTSSEFVIDIPVFSGPATVSKPAIPSESATSSQSDTSSEHVIPSDTIVSREVQLKKHRELTQRWEELVEEIRKKDGFQDFLKAASFSTLRKAAIEGPIILINVSEYRSDAIIVSAAIDPVLVPLPGLNPDDLEDLSSDFISARSSHSDKKLLSVLKRLWKMVVDPVVNHLKVLGVERKSRIWWCPTSKLCALPLHAAGPYTQGEKNLPDLFISSYTSTLSALITARETQEGRIYSTLIPRLLVVSEPDSGSIPAVEEEVRRIQDLGTPVHLLSGEAANCENVVRGLRKYRWAHFACHGILDPIPFHSSFKLHNQERFRLLDIIKARLPEAEFVFLSACHAAAVDIEGVPDEVIHLSAAMQFCGFRSVVGTLWAMADEDGPDVAEHFYRYMFRNLVAGQTKGDKVDFRDAAAALNTTTKEMRRRKIPLSRWVNFVHIGA